MVLLRLFFSWRKTYEQLIILNHKWLHLESVLINEFGIETFCHIFALTAINVCGELHFGHVGWLNDKCGPIRTRKFIMLNCMFNYMFKGPTGHSKYSLL